MRERWVCLDVGETLIDETRIWSIWADELGVPRLTLMAALGAVIARGGEHRDVFPIFGAEDWPLRLTAIEPPSTAMSVSSGSSKISAQVRKTRVSSTRVSPTSRTTQRSPAFVLAAIR